jgi:hypothetical protein
VTAVLPSASCACLAATPTQPAHHLPAHHLPAHHLPSPPVDHHIPSTPHHTTPHHTTPHHTTPHHTTPHHTTPHHTTPHHTHTYHHSDAPCPLLRPCPTARAGQLAGPPPLQLQLPEPTIHHAIPPRPRAAQRAAAVQPAVQPAVLPRAAGGAGAAGIHARSSGRPEGGQ